MFEFGVTVPILGREECGYYNGNRSCIIIPFQVLSRVISFRSLRTSPHEISTNLTATIVVLKLDAYNRHPSSKPLPSWLLTSQTMLNSSLNVWGILTVTAYNWWCKHDKLISENIPNLYRKWVYFHYQRWLLWSRSPDDLFPVVPNPTWGDNSNNL